MLTVAAFTRLEISAKRLSMNLSCSMVVGVSPEKRKPELMDAAGALV
jgi:hypothetical protein